MTQHWEGIFANHAEDFQTHTSHIKTTKRFCPELVRGKCGERCHSALLYYPFISRGPNVS